jgi:hypothetical protein
MENIDTSHNRLPANRAFVIQFYSSCSTENSIFKGRLEHLTSGEAKKFSSKKELYNILEQVLSQQENERKYFINKTRR